MGDIKKKVVRKKSIAEQVQEREARKLETVHMENETIEVISKKSGMKDKAISARVNGGTYVNFKKVCEARGLSANACLNMLITDFVRENQELLGE